MRDINEIEFNSILQEKGKLVVIDFWAEWCNPCKMLNPVLEKLDKEINDVEFVKINTEKYGDIADSYSIGTIPTLLIFKNGEIINKIAGFKPEIVIKKEILKSLGDL